MHTAPATELPRPLILYIEDDIATSGLFRMAADELGCHFQLVVVEDETSAMRFLASQEPYQGYDLPDLIVLDIHLRGASGFAILEQIRRTDRLCHLATIIFSTSLLSVDRDRAMMLGALDYLQKPIDMDGFWNAVRRICSMASREIH